MTSMFSTKENGRELEDKEIETRIGPSVKVEGTFVGEGNVVVEGEVVGIFKTSKDLTVGKDARIKADVTAANMFISGEVRGNLHASGRVELTAAAKIFGDIETSIISVESGAIIKGQCITGKENGESMSPVGQNQNIGEADNNDAQQKQKRVGKK